MHERRFTTRSPDAARPAGPPALASARVHEAAGSGRHAFALFHAVHHPGPLIWILPAHEGQMPLLCGLPPGVGERLLLLRPRGETGLLWAAEESLRAAPVGLVIAEPAHTLSLTAGRRLQLAAEAGRTTGLMLIRQGAGSNAAETRWQCEPLAAPAGVVRHRWVQVKNRKGIPLEWLVDWDGATPAFHPSPPAAQPAALP